MQQVSICVDVVGTGSDGTEPSVVFSIKKHGVYSDDVHVVNRYMFNCGEGTQRLCNENGLKLSTLNSIFLSRLDPLTCSGIPGMILALGSCGAPDLRVTGPSGTHSFITSTKSFARRTYPSISCSEIDSTTQIDTTSHIAYSKGNSGNAIIDDNYVQIKPFSVDRHKIKPRQSHNCQRCQHHGPDKKSPSTVLQDKPVINRVVSQNAREQLMVNWLESFYRKHDASKLPYIQVILSKYQGRHDELKRMLSAKYGNADSSSSSSEDSDEELESSPEDPGNPTTDSKDESSSEEESSPKIASQAVDTACPSEGDPSNLMETWLHSFYTKHNPVMLPRMASILQKYQGREQELRTMLEEKYLSSKRENEESEVEPPLKKTKVDADETNRNDKYVAPPNSPGPWPMQHDQILFYTLEFKGPSPTLVWIVDVPDVEWIERAFSQMTSCPIHRPALIVHMTPSHVAIHPSYVKWMEKSASADTRHLLFDGNILQSEQDGRQSIAFKASAELRLQLNAKAPSTFPLSSTFTSIQSGLSSSRLLVRSPTALYNVALPRMSYQLKVAKPNQTLGFHYDKSPWLVPVPKNSPEHMQSLTASNVEPSVVFLGTGSAAPSKLRNSSAIYFSYAPPSWDGMLIDCGEGTFGQLWRQFGENTHKRLAELKCIWISHNHADHHCGLLRVLMERHRSFLQGSRQSSPLVVIAPDAVLAYVARWKAEWLQSVHLVTCKEFNYVHNPIRRMVFDMTGFQFLLSVPVFHCHDSFGLIFFCQNGMKVVYSGDTRPCDRLIHEGFSADILIHEATFEDSMLEDAIQKKHSTVGEAIDVGIRMQAKIIMLTHFSQRYPRLPPQAMHGPGLPIGFAFDGMKVSLSYHHRATQDRLTAYMKALLSDDKIVNSSSP